MQILGAPYQVPINISTDLSLSFDAYESNLLAFGADNAPGPESAYLRAPYGLLNVDIGVELPHDHLTAVNVRLCWELVVSRYFLSNTLLCKMHVVCTFMATMLVR